MKNTIINSLLPLENGLFIPDGEPYVFDDTLYLYGSRDVYSGDINGVKAWCSHDYHVICSRDLKTWDDCGVSYTIDEIPKQYTDRKPIRLWAPDVCFNPKDKKYYLFSCLNTSNGYFVASSPSPTGPFTDTKRLTIDNKDIFPKCIDPGVLLDDDGKAYINWPGGKNHPWSIAQLDPEDFSNIIGETITEVKGLVDPFEGPSLRKRGDTYYYIYIQNLGPETDHNKTPLRMAYMTSKNPLGPYENQGVIIDTGDYPGAGNVHGSIVEWQNKWYVFYHLPLQGYKRTRYACAAPLDFNSDGTIEQAKPLSCGPRPYFELEEEIPAYSAVVYSGGRPEQRCDFTTPGDYFLFFDRVSQYAGYRYVNFADNACKEVQLKIQSDVDAVFELRADEHDGQLLATINVKAGNDYIEFLAPVSGQISQRHTVYLRLTEKQSEARVKVKSLKFLKI